MNYNILYYINKGRMLNCNINIEKQLMFDIYNKTLDEFMEVIWIYQLGEIKTMFRQTKSY